MNKIFYTTFYIILLTCSPSVLFAQTLPPVDLKDGWTRIYIEQVGTIDLPPTMEVQGGRYKEIIDNQLGLRGIPVSKLVAQQNGLNEFKNLNEKYARVMLDTEIGRHGDYEKLNFNINTYKKSDIAELDIIFKQQVIQFFLLEYASLNLGTMKLIEWTPIKFEIINGMSCIHARYIRQLNDNPLVVVHNYTFHNNDRIHNLTMSYRISEYEHWSNDFSDILNSFRITNVR